MSAPGSPSLTTPVPSATYRVKVFVDYWNLQLTLNEREARSKKSNARNERFPIDFIEFPKVLVREAGAMLSAGCSYEGMIVYTSANTATAEGRKYKKWATTWLDRQPGVQVICLERQQKRPPQCRHCGEVIKECIKCKGALSGTVEKGVDAGIVTDMIRLAWDKAYDVGIIVSSDSDLVPAIEFLDSRNLRFLQAGFPPIGSDLATSCWGSFDLFALRGEFKRS